MTVEPRQCPWRLRDGRPAEHGRFAHKVQHDDVPLSQQAYEGPLDLALGREGHQVVRDLVVHELEPSGTALILAAL
jgi:hypothetical protein